MAEADSQHNLLPASTLDKYKVFTHIDMAVHRDMAVASNSTWVRFGGSGSLVELKWCHYIMVEADSQLKLLPASTIDKYKVFKHIDMLSMGIWQ